MAIIKKLTKRGFTLIELMIVVVIIGILASLAIYGVNRYVSNSKTAEARLMLGHFSKSLVKSFEGEIGDGVNLTLGDSIGTARILCQTAGKLIPTGMPAVKGKKYQSKPSEWTAGDATTGWACVGSSINSPQYYQYGYTSSGTGSPAAANESMAFIANGDLDADGLQSQFTFPGSVQADSTTGELVLTVANKVTETLPEE